VGEAANADELFGQLTVKKPELIILDIVLPDISGIEITRILRRQMPNIKILILTAEGDSETLMELTSIGIDGFISKASPFDELLKAIRIVANGGVYYGKDSSKVLTSVRISKPNINSKIFTARETEIIELCAKGLTAKEIAEKLDIAIKTVTTHKYNIFKKLGINNSVELVNYCLKNHIVRL